MVTVTVDLYECATSAYAYCNQVAHAERPGAYDGDLAFALPSVALNPCKYYRLSVGGYGPSWGMGRLELKSSGGEFYYVIHGAERVSPRFCPNPVVIVPGLLGSGERGGGWVMDPIFGSYDGLASTLSNAGYVASTTLFTLPYDWRRSNVETAALLKSKLESIRSACRCPKVDVVAHSMGGLAVRSYLGSPDYAGDVGKVVFLGTPHKGAPEDYLAWEGGEVRPGGIASWVLGLLLSHQAKENGYPDVFSYIRGFPVRSIEELLPAYSYLKPAEGEAPAYPAGHPANPFLASLPDGAAGLASVGVPIVNIISGSDSSTVSAIRTSLYPGSGSKWQDGKPQGYEFAPGDGTVPKESSSLGPSFDVAIDSSHADLPSKSASLVIAALTETDDSKNDRPLPPSASITFGNSGVTQDVAQGFVPERAGALEAIELYIKRNSSVPADASVRIVADIDGLPMGETLATAGLAASDLDVSYTWQKVSFAAHPVLAAGSKYWIVIDADQSLPGYYILAANSSYSLGQAKIGRSDQARWFDTSPEGLSAYFRLKLSAPRSAAPAARRSIRRMLAAMVYSPVSVMVTAPDGKRVGFDPAIGAEVNEIDGAYYSGAGSPDQFLTIPDPIEGEYAVRAVGTASGGFEIEMANISDQSLSTTTLSGQTEPGRVSSFEIKVAGDSIEDATPAVAVPPIEAPASTPPSADPVSEPAREQSRAETMRAPAPQTRRAPPRKEKARPSPANEPEISLDIPLDEFVQRFSSYEPPQKPALAERKVAPAPANAAAAYFSLASVIGKALAYLKSLIGL